MPEINLHELVNRPGYGVAQTEIRAAGHWDETVITGEGETGELRKFRVRVSCSIPASRTLTVWATSAEQAVDDAEEQAWARDFDWGEYDEPEDVFGEVV